MYLFLSVILSSNSITKRTYADAYNLTLHSCNDRPKQFKIGSFGLKMMINNKMLPDDFCHEQYLLIEENNKKILISGCSHKGILNIAEWFSPDCLLMIHWKDMHSISTALIPYIYLPLYRHGAVQLYENIYGQTELSFYWRIYYYIITCVNR